MARSLSATEGERAVDRQAIKATKEKYLELGLKELAALTWVPCVACKFLCPLEWSDPSIDGKPRHASCEPERVEIVGAFAPKPRKSKKAAPAENQDGLF